MEEGAMAKELLPDALWARIAPLLPPEPPKPKGGRPRVSDRAALTGILFVLKTGIPWEYLPAEMGCGSGMTCWRRLRDWYQAGVWRRLHQVLLEELAQADRIDWDRAALDSAAVTAPGGGQETGKNPTDRGKQGTKRHLVVDAHGIPLAVLVSAANVHDSKMMLATVDAIEPIRAAGLVADRTSSMPTRVTTTVTSVWPCASAASSPASPAVVSSPRTAWDATGGWSNGRSPGSTASGA
jgi:transposase